MIKKSPSNFRPLTKLALVIMVGLTGVGKSTTLKLLQKNGLIFTLLPDRRTITNAIIISSLQQQAGQTPHLLTDQMERFKYTARYRAKYPGGTAHALGQLAADPAKLSSLLIFDGLRGLNEVQYATAYFPKARFVVFDAPDIVRLERLLKRGHFFDAKTIHTSLLGKNLMAALMSTPNIEAIFNEEELRQIARIARATRLSTDIVLKAVTVIVEERRHYDPYAARAHLTQKLSSKQLMVIDTAAHSPEVAAQRMAKWLSDFEF